MKIIDASSRLIVKAHNNIAFAHPSIPGRAVSLERYNQDSALNRKVIIAHDTSRKRNVLAGQANITPTHLAGAYQAAGNELGCINRSSKRDSLGGQNHRRLDHWLTLPRK